MSAVTIEWFGCATFRMRIDGTTLFFDTYLDKARVVAPRRRHALGEGRYRTFDHGQPTALFPALS